MSDQIQTIKARLNIVDIVREYVPTLKKAGRSYKGLSPFNKEKSPSFTVDEEKQLFYCFSTAQGGDLIRFVELVEHTDFHGALQLLAERAGVTLEREASAVPASERERLQSLCQATQEFFEVKLHQSNFATDYFTKDRHLSSELVHEFHLGYAPNDFHELLNHLKEKGYTEREVATAGLATTRETGGPLYDRFRHRVIFPIHSVQGQVVAFGGRAFGDEKPKYLNSAESPLYKKSNILFNLAKARPAIRERDSVVIVEGYFDAIASHIAGVKNVVAPCGTALTSEQLLALKRFTKKIILAFDTDEAGQKATVRAILLAQPLELEIYVAQIPEGKDPDEFVQANPGVWEKIITQSISAWDFLLSHVLRKYDVKNLKDRQQIVSELAEYILTTLSPLAREEYVKELADTLGTSAETLAGELRRHRYAPAQTSPQRTSTVHSAPTKADLALGFVVNHPDWATEIDPAFLPPSLLKKACISAKITYTNTGNSSLTEENLLVNLTPEERLQAQVLGLRVAEEYQTFSEELQTLELKKLLAHLKKDSLKAQVTTLKSELVIAQKAGDEARAGQLTQEIQTLHNLTR